MKQIKRIAVVVALVVLATESSYAAWYDFFWPFRKRETVVKIETNVKQQVATGSQFESQKVANAKLSISTTTTAVSRNSDSKVPEIKKVAPVDIPKPTTAATSVGAVASIKSFFNSNTTAAPKEITLTIITTAGGYVYYPENTIACYGDQTCGIKTTSSKKTQLKAVAMPGYTFKGWSEGSCGSSNECSVLFIEDTKVYARFEVTGQIKREGRITSLTRPLHICSISLGASGCNLNIRWINNLGLDMTIKVDDKEYYLKVEDEDDGYPKLPVSQKDISEAVNENSSGPVFFKVFPGKHTIDLYSNGQLLDTAKVEVKCKPEHYWDGTKCWEKGANNLFFFKQQGIAVRSIPEGIACGYRPEQCLAAFSSNAKVTLVAEPILGYSFGEWTGDCSGSKPTCVITMDKARSVGITNSLSNTVKNNDEKKVETNTGGAVAGCVPNWQCNGWGACVSMKLSRTCYDTNSCNSSVNKPQTSLNCDTQTSTLR
jgi:hypothetical protein